MLAHVLWTIAGCLLVFSVGGYFVLRIIYCLGYTDGVADLELTLEDSLKRKLRKEAEDA